MNKIVLVCFGALIFFTTKIVESKSENLKIFLRHYELSKPSEYKRQLTRKSIDIKDAEKSIEIKAFGQTFIIDLSVYYPEEDVSVAYISAVSNSTSSFLDSNLLIYYGDVRNVKDSFAVGSFDSNNLFRGYVATDDVYCIEPYLDQDATVIVYKMSEVIFPGCIKSAEGKELDCSETKFYSPWIPQNSSMKIHHTYNWFYYKYLQLLKKLKWIKANYNGMSAGESFDAKQNGNDTNSDDIDDLVRKRFSDTGEKYFLHKRTKHEVKGESDGDGDYRSYQESIGLLEDDRDPMETVSLELESHSLDSETTEGAKDDDPVHLQCDLEIVFGPSMSKRFGFRDDDLIKDIFTQFTLLNKIFRKVIFPKADRPAQVFFKIHQISAYGPDNGVYSVPNPFSREGDLQHFVNNHSQVKQYCLVIGLMNRFLRNGEFVHGYIPIEGGGACTKDTNVIIVSYGNSKYPVPMALSFAALIRGITRVLGANDEFSMCAEGPFPNPMKVLQEYLITKDITPGNGYSIFTKCNIEEIAVELHNRKCLIEAHEPLCGNGILDEGEECDCGPNYLCNALDSCCTPRHMMTVGNNEVSYEGCKLKNGSYCSAHQPCCFECNITQAETKCVSGLGVCDIGKCDGASTDCPRTSESSDGEVCESGNEPEPMICYGGSCVLALCTGNGLQPCTCELGTGNECVYCCLSEGKCRAAGSQLGLMKGADFHLPDGANCIGGTCEGGMCNRLNSKFPNIKVPKNSGHVISTTIYSCAHVTSILLMLQFAWSYNSGLYAFLFLQS